LSELSDAEYDALEPVQWPVTSQAPQGTQRLFSDGKFYTPSGKARMIAIAPQLPAVPVDADFPLVLNNGRIRDQWHTMTRTGKVPRLNAHLYESFVQVQARDATTYNLQEGGLAKLSSRHGTMLARVQVSEDQRSGSVFVPIHWSESCQGIAGRCAGRTAYRSVFWSAGIQTQSGQGCAISTCLAGLCVEPQRLDLLDTSYCSSSQRDGYGGRRLLAKTYRMTG